jgi:hypothetical protein
MRLKPRQPSANRAAAIDVDDFLPPPPRLSQEAAGQFRALREQIMASVEPENFLERVYANEMAHLLWQIRASQARIERLTANAREEGLLRLLAGRCNDLPNLITGLRLRAPDAMETLAALLEEFGLTSVDVEAHARAAIAGEVANIERDCDAKRDQFDSLVQSFEKRRFLIAERCSRLAETKRRELAPPPPLLTGTDA